MTNTEINTVTDNKRNNGGVAEIEAEVKAEVEAAANSTKSNSSNGRSSSNSKCYYVETKISNYQDKKGEKLI